MPALRFANEGAIEDVLNINGVAYYQWLPAAIDVLKPKQVVELGGAMGVSTIMMLQAKHQDFRLYSITLPEHGLEYSYIKDNYSNLTMVVGDDLDLKNWPEDLDLAKTDLWLFDTIHTKIQLESELKLYEPFFKEGAVLLFDDIHISPEMDEVWETLKARYDNWDCSDPLHYSGFGICCV